jgi:uncharacterized protein (TIGR02453 family)
MAHATRAFSPALFAFLRELQANNDREWFKANKARYEDSVQEPALAFIAGFQERLDAISPHFTADARPVGGSLFRIHRDTRFSKDKTPYKSHSGIQFRHETGKDAHAPMFYLHLAPGQVFAAGGSWRPDSALLARIRELIDSDGEAWDEAKELAAPVRLSGECLKRPPAGYAADHPRIEDLKRKDFVAVVDLRERDVTAAGFEDRLAEAYAGMTPLVRFLCRAAEVAF